MELLDYMVVLLCQGSDVFFSYSSEPLDKQIMVSIYLLIDIELFPLWGYCEQDFLEYLCKVFAELMLIKF